MSRSDDACDSLCRYCGGTWVPFAADAARHSDACGGCLRCDRPVFERCDEPTPLECADCGNPHGLVAHGDVLVCGSCVRERMA